MKRLIRSVLIFIVFVLGILTIGFTHTGNQWLWQQAQKQLPELEGELVSGHLGTGWTFRNLGWNNDQVSFNSRQLSLEWNPLSLLKGRLWVTDITATHPTLELLPSSEQDSVSEGSSSELSIPLSVDIDRVTINDFKFQQEGLTTSFKKLSTAVHLNKAGLVVDSTLLDNLNIAASSTADSASAATKPADDPITLPAIQLPFPVKLQKLELVNTQYDQEVIPGITLKMAGQAHQLTIEQLTVFHPLANTELSGHISLANDYPLTLAINSIVKKDQIDALPDNQRLSINLTGSLQQLAIKITTAGSFNAKVTGEAQPLIPNLPFELNLLWDKIQWPLAGTTPDATLEQGQLTAKGTLQNYAFTLDALAKLTAQPPITVDINGEGTTRNIYFNNIDLRTSEGAAAISGSLDWENDIQWQGDMALSHVNPAHWVSELPGEISGNIHSQFKLRDNQWQLAIPELNLSGTLRDHTVTMKGKLLGDQDLHWTIDFLNVRLGENQLSAQGQLADNWNLNARIDGKKLSELYPGLGGSLEGTFQLTGNQENPSINYQLTSPLLIWQALSLKQLSSAGAIIKDDEIRGEATLNLDQFNGSGIKLKHITLAVKGSESSHQLSLGSEGNPVAPSLNLSGSWLNNRWNGILTKAHLRTDIGKWQLNKPAQITFNNHQVLALSRQCWQSGQAQLCLDPAEISAAEGSTAFTLSQFSLETLKPFFPDNFSWQAVTSAQGQVAWKNSAPTLSLAITTTPGTLEAGPIKSDYDTLAVQVNVANDKMHSTLGFKSQQLGQADIDLSVSDIQDRRQLAGTLHTDNLMIHILSPFLPDTRDLTGTVSAQGRFGGTLEKPLFHGFLELAEGGLKTTTDMVTISELDTRLEIAGDQANITGKMNVGDGTLNLGGQINWQNLSPSGQITAKGSGLEAQYPGVGAVHISPDLRVLLGNNQKIEGTLAIPWARIKIKSLPKQAVTRSDDVIVIKSGAVVTDKKELATPIEIDTQILLGNDVQLDAFGLKTHLTGRLNLLQKPEKPLEAHGTIQLKEGRYRSFGQNLVIRNGKIIFSGPLDNPYLVVDAIRNPDAIEDNVTVGVMVNGPAAKPGWEIFSDPSMPQTEQFSYLLRGRAMKASSGDSNALQSMLLGLGVSQIGGVVSDIGEAVGFEDVSLDTEGNGEDTQVTVSGYISPDIQVQYGVGVFSSVGEMKVKYELMPRLYLQAVSGLAQALDIFYRFSL
ncbi:translocation/assembly module TamB [Endozoicomonas sp. Mp262]|uniref:autotransporter assembly complex protein TamB n=1 Tax=Endozoicomonas sp. Mp262 TaxID=2919499 RepID=UPI0021DA6CF4